MRKACQKAKQVKLYTFNTKSGVWWKQSKKDFATISAEVYQFDFEEIQAFAQLIERTMDFSLTITDSVLYIAADKGSCEINLTRLQPE